LVFHPQRRGVLDYVAYYAQKTQLDAKGNRILWGWIQETRPETEFSACGWAGCMALPRILSLNSENELEMKVAPVADSLRAKQLAAATAITPSEERNKIVSAVEIQNLCAELHFTVASAAFAVTIADSAGPWWSLKAQPSGAGTTLEINGKSIAIPRQSGDLKFHVYLDASVAEFFANDLHVLTTRIYRKPDGALRLNLSDNALSNLKDFAVWQLRPISPDRLTT
jgi:beta-fructofuranosidase